MTCVKRMVTAVLVTKDGRHYVGTNSCLEPQVQCPRQDGDDYEKCKTICKQNMHAEASALFQAYPNTIGSTLYLFGHFHLCDSCTRLCNKLGVKDVVIVE